MKWIGLVICWLAGNVLAADNGDGEWSVRSYALPSDFFLEGASHLPSVLVTGSELESRKELAPTGIPSKAPPDSDEEIDEEKIKASIKETSKRCREVLKGLPEGTLIAIDHSRSMVAARTTEDGHGLIWTMLETLMSNLPTMLSVQVSLIEVPSAEGVTLLAEMAAVTDHSAFLERLEKEGARVVATAKLETKNGQRATTKMLSEVSHITLFAARADGSTESTSREVEPVGLTVEVDPVVSADGQTLHLNVAIRHTARVGDVRLLPLGTLAGKRVEGGVQDFVSEKWTTATTLLSGQSRLLGVAQAKEAGKMRLCFVSAAAARVHLVLANDGRAASWLSKYGESIERVPSGVKGSNWEVPEGMVKKAFRIPWDLLSHGVEVGGDNNFQPTDPFAPPNSSPVTVWKSAKEILMEQGIVFPEGSSAAFNKQTSTLTVVNTPPMVDLVETFIDGMMYAAPVLLRFQLHVVEADSAVVRKVGRESLGVTDHRAAWAALQAEITAGRGRMVESAAIEAKSGQRCTVESGRSYAWGTAKLTSQVPQAKGDKASVVVTGVPVAELVATVERKSLGLRWEIDPLLGVDGFTIDVNTSIKRHSLEPSERFEVPVPQEGVLTVNAPAVDFHPLELVTAFTTQDGMWRMIGTWQPVGADGELDSAVMQAVFLQTVVLRVGQ